MKNKKPAQLGKSLKEKNLSEDEGEMAYYCLVCRCRHYPGNEIWWRHRIYASRKFKPKKVVKRKVKRIKWW